MRVKVNPLVWVPERNDYVHKATVIKELGGGGGLLKASADRVLRARALKKERQARQRSDLSRDDWDIGINSDIAVVWMDGSVRKVAVGRITRIVKKGKKKNSKRIDYRNPVCVSTLEDRNKLAKDGVTFNCHFYTWCGERTERKQEQKDNRNYNFGESPFEMIVVPHSIVSPVCMAYKSRSEHMWEMNIQSHRIVTMARAGQNTISIAKIR